MHEKSIITHLQNRQAFLDLLANNPGLIIIKFGATWCGPCKVIAPNVHRFFASSPENVICADIDADESFDVYSYLKSKRMINGIPVILCYKKGNITFVPDDSITGADINKLNLFFARCQTYL
jgi:thioredoxin 1